MLFLLLRRKGRQGWSLFWYGLIIFCVGLVITVASYAMASRHGGGTYIITWGSMLVGVMAMVRGAVSGVAAKRAQTQQLGNGYQPSGVGQQPYGGPQQYGGQGQQQYSPGQQPVGGPRQQYGGQGQLQYGAPQQQYGGQGQPWMYAPPPAPRPQANGMPAAGTPEGWYPDPVSSGNERWWDGRAWTPGTRPPGAL